MSINNINILYISMISSLLLSCANNNDMIKKDIATPISNKDKSISHVFKNKASTVESIKRCKRTQRDLLSNWEHRKYWCTRSGRVISLENKSKEYIAIVKAVNKSNNALDKVNLKLENAIINKAIVKTKSIFIPKVNTPINIISTNNTSSPCILKEPKTKNVNSIIVNHNEITSNEVWFSDKREYLDVDDKQIETSLFPNAMHANKIILQGHIEEGEVYSKNDIDFEKFSVGRSLTVKKLLMEQGIDKSKIKILHYKFKPKGRYVEVNFNG